ncbi:hypothetical protein OKW32_007350 [Paraburkholderia youngii]
MADIVIAAPARARAPAAGPGGLWIAPPLAVLAARCSSTRSG